MRRVLYITPFGSLQGGGQRSLYLLLKYLDKERFKAFLIVPDKDELYEEAEKLGVKVFVLAFPRLRSFKIFSCVYSLIKLCKIAEKEEISLIDTDSPREAFYAFLASKLFGIPAVFHARVSDSFLWLDRILYRLAGRIITVSQAVAERFNKIDKMNKIRVIYNSAELDIFDPELRVNKRKDKFILGYFGRIDRRKCIETAVNAVKMTKKDLEFIIMGKGTASIWKN